MRGRRGFTITELLVATIVMSILGTVLARMLIQDSRFVSKLEAMMDARQSARAAMNTMAVEMRMVSQSGLTAATTKKITVRAPYGWGMACDRSAADTRASLVPADSMMYASALPDGLAWRDSTGNFNYVAGISVASFGTTTACTNEGVQILPGGQLVTITMPDVMIPGTLFFLYQTLTYEFKSSTELPGRTGLWRKAGTGADEEILAPFDTTAGFAFYVLGTDSALTNPPVDLNDVIGLELLLHGESEMTPQGETTPQDFDLQTRVTFLNTN
jgi:prepilin-type N-terminal cleavage/methylation domain-containing protein